MTNDIDFPPDDEFNRELLDNVHPVDWENPTPKGRYHLVVIGAGTAGLVTAAGATGLGAKVALIERNLMGGDCLNVGCVPSKALISAARKFATIRDSGAFGIEIDGNVNVNFPAVMERMRKLRSGISRHDSAKRFQELGVDVFIGDGRFEGDRTVMVGDKKLSYKNAVICTGARASAIPIPGLSDVEYLTNENLFSLTELPPRFAIIGAGPIGCEMAQCFARFGSEVTLFEMQDHVLSREDADAALIVEESLRKDGINLMTGSSNMQIKPAGNEKKIYFQQAGEEKEIVVDQILVSVGRTPNVEGLNLEEVNVQYDARSGVQVDDKLRTTNKHIYAAGDICFPYKFTHTADFQARIVIGNTLFMGRSKTSKLTIPWCTYTDPEIAHVGLYEHQAKEKGYEIDTFVQPFSGVDRAILDGEEEGFAKVHVKKGTDQILGATIVAAHAGDLISEFTLAITNDIGLSGIGKTIHPYPTQADSIRKLGDAYSRTRLTPFVKKLFNFWLRITR